MKEINDFMSKILFKSNSYDIFGYFDFYNKNNINNNEIVKQLNQLSNNYSILQNEIIYDDNKVYFKKINNFKFSKYYTIKEIPYTKFDKYTDILLNKPLKNRAKWFYYLCIDKTTNKIRIYFKCNHLYGDGYKLQEIFFGKIFTNKFTRKTTFLNKIYQIIIGTIILILTYIYYLFKFIYKYLFKKNDINRSKIDTDYIICKKLSLNIIKTFCTQKKITINDFLYMLSIKSYQLYFNKKTTTTMSLINNSKLTNINNFIPIFDINNSISFKKLHERFNNYKLSLFIPLLTYIYNNTYNALISKKLISFLKYLITDSYDLLFSNIIGPNNVNIDNIGHLTDFKFFINSPKLSYNIISCNDNINIVITFKKNLINNKNKFNECIISTYNDLINS